MIFADYFFSDPNLTEDFIVVYAGRFQPFHINHYLAYEELVGKFGRDKVYVSASDKVDPPRSPFNFTDKKKIMVNMFDMPDDKIFQVKSPYQPTEIFNSLDNKNVGFILAICEKDIDRVSDNDYYVPYADDNVFNTKHGYVYVIEEKISTFEGEVITGSLIRRVFRTKNVKRKIQLFNNVYPEFDKDVFKMLVERINNS